MLKKIKLLLIYFFIITVPLLANDSYSGNEITQQTEIFSSPSLRFNAMNPKESIHAILNKFGATQNNKAMFQEMMDNEELGFFGYHAGCSDYRIFQDVIKIAIEEYLGISIRSDFQFLRTPGLSIFSFESADAFVAHYPSYDDQQDFIKRHILSLNMALYKSWNAEWDFTPRYFLQNRPWTFVHFENELLPFFQKMGIDSASIREIFQLARRYVPQNKGMILQFFDHSHQSSLPYAFLNEQAYIGTSERKIPNTTPSEFYMDANKTYFPQLRLVLNNSKTLNPNSPLIIRRYSTMSPEKEMEYEKVLREFMQGIPLDQEKAETFRDELLNYWYSE